MKLWWHSLPAALQFPEWICEWWGSSRVQLVFDYNWHDKREAVKKKKTLQGGTLQISWHVVALTQIEQGTDPEGSGHWCQTKIRHGPPRLQHISMFWSISRCLTSVGTNLKSLSTAQVQTVTSTLLQCSSRVGPHVGEPICDRSSGPRQ
jgi:hypothetical protein